MRAVRRTYGVSSRGDGSECAGAENPRAGDQSDEVYPGLMQGRSTLCTLAA